MLAGRGALPSAMSPNSCQPQPPADSRSGARRRRSGPTSAPAVRARPRPGPRRHRAEPPAAKAPPPAAEPPASEAGAAALGAGGRSRPPVAGRQEPAAPPHQVGGDVAPPVHPLGSLHLFRRLYRRRLCAFRPGCGGAGGDGTHHRRACRRQSDRQEGRQAGVDRPGAVPARRQHAPGADRRGGFPAQGGAGAAFHGAGRRSSPPPRPIPMRSSSRPGLPCWRPTTTRRAPSSTATTTSCGAPTAEMTISQVAIAKAQTSINAHQAALDVAKAEMATAQWRLEPHRDRVAGQRHHHQPHLRAGRHGDGEHPHDRHRRRRRLAHHGQLQAVLRPLLRGRRRGLGVARQRALAPLSRQDHRHRPRLQPRSADAHAAALRRADDRLDPPAAAHSGDDRAGRSAARRPCSTWAPTPAP